MRTSSLISLGRRWNRVLPLVLVLALLTPLAHWLSQNDDDVLVEEHRGPREPLFVLPQKLAMSTPPPVKKHDFVADGQIDMGGLFLPKDQNKGSSNVKLPKEDKEEKVEKPPEMPSPTQIVKSVLVRMGNAPLNDSAVKVIGKQRSSPGYLTIGIPTIYREMSGTQYLITTIKSLLENLDPVDELPEVTILIFAADQDEKIRQNLISEINSTYHKELESGVLQILTVDKSAYPPLDGLKRNYNDAEERVRWRAKQVVDFAFMFYYAKNMSQYYIQLEDDVISAPHFFSMIRAYVSSQTAHWVTLDFSSLGFIGKLFKSSDMEKFSRFLLMFYDEQPVDYLLILFQKTLLQNYRLLHRPTLFQHFGEHSSLKGKKSSFGLKDQFFALGKNAKLPFFTIIVNSTKNPPAQILTSMSQYGEYAPELPYEDNKGYFWAQKPKLDDIYLVIFQKPQKLQSVFIQTGQDSQRNDYLRSAVLEISAPTYSHDKQQQPQNVDELTAQLCEGFIEVAEFDKGIAYADHLDSAVKGLTKCLRIRVTESQDEWIIFSDMKIKSMTLPTR